MAAVSDPIDIPTSKLRTIGFAAGLLIFAGLFGWLLVIGAFPPGSLKQAVMGAGLALCFAGLIAMVVTYRQGAVVSVGPLGVFDRRLSTDWIPWPAITALETIKIQRTHLLQVRLDPAQDAAVPLTARARRGERANARFGYPGYSITATTLRGGFPALLAAVGAHAPPRLSVGTRPGAAHS